MRTSRRATTVWPTIEYGVSDWPRRATSVPLTATITRRSNTAPACPSGAPWSVRTPNTASRVPTRAGCRATSKDRLAPSSSTGCDASAGLLNSALPARPRRVSRVSGLGPPIAVAALRTRLGTSAPAPGASAGRRTIGSGSSQVNCGPMVPAAPPPVSRQATEAPKDWLPAGHGTGAVAALTET